jgi:hypothetical protein
MAPLLILGRPLHGVTYTPHLSLEVQPRLERRHARRRVENPNGSRTRERSGTGSRKTARKRRDRYLGKSKKHAKCEARGILPGGARG